MLIAFLKEGLDSIRSQSCKPGDAALIADGPINDELEAVIVFEDSFGLRLEIFDNVTFDEIF